MPLHGSCHLRRQCVQVYPYLDNCSFWESHLTQVCLMLLGPVASCIFRIPYAKLHLKPFQRWLNLQVTDPEQVLSSLLWWNDARNACHSIPFISPSFSKTRIIDASRKHIWSFSDSQAVSPFILPFRDKCFGTRSNKSDVQIFPTSLIRKNHTGHSRPYHSNVFNVFVCS